MLSEWLGAAFDGVCDLGEVFIDSGGHVSGSCNKVSITYCLDPRVGHRATERSVVVLHYIH